MKKRNMWKQHETIAVIKSEEKYKWVVKNNDNGWTDIYSDNISEFRV